MYTVQAIFLYRQSKTVVEWACVERSEVGGATSRLGQLVYYPHGKKKRSFGILGLLAQTPSPPPPAEF